MTDKADVAAGGWSTSAARVDLDNDGLLDLVVSAIAEKLKVDQHNKVDDDATIALDYPDGTVIIEASWNWPYSMGQVQVCRTQREHARNRERFIFPSRR